MTQQQREISEHDITDWFKELKPVYDSYDFDPAFIFNWDEAYLHARSKSGPLVYCKYDEQPTVQKARDVSEHVSIGLVCLFGLFFTPLHI